MNTEVLYRGYSFFRDVITTKSSNEKQEESNEVWRIRTPRGALMLRHGESQADAMRIVDEHVRDWMK